MLNCIREDLKRFVPNNQQYKDNLGLRLEKLNCAIDEPADDKPDEKNAALNIMQSFKLNASSKKVYAYSFNTWENAVLSLKDTECFYIKSKTKTLLGTGNASVFEFGFNLLKPFGTPYISGSSLKGLVSSYLAKNGGDDWWKSPKNTEKSKSQVQVFGGRYEKEDYIGSVHFYDARISPNESHWFVNDIITTHYQQYYGGKRLPDGTENPIPIKIAALDEGLKFFVVLQGPEQDRRFVKKILLQALQTEGIGGKTAVGYGRFGYIKGENEKLDEIRNADIDAFLKFAKNKEKLGKNESYDNAVREALEKNELSEKLVNAYRKYSPLRFIRWQISQNMITTLDDLNKTEKEIRKNLKAYPIRKTNIDGKFVFDFVLKNFGLSTDQISEHRLLNQIAYSWDDVDITNNNIYDIIDGLDERVWPKAEDLKKWIENSELADKNDLLEFLE